MCEYDRQIGQTVHPVSNNKRKVAIRNVKNEVDVKTEKCLDANEDDLIIEPTVQTSILTRSQSKRLFSENVQIKTQKQSVKKRKNI